MPNLGFTRGKVTLITQELLVGHTHSIKGRADKHTAGVKGEEQEGELERLASFKVVPSVFVSIEPNHHRNVKTSHPLDFV